MARIKTSPVGNGVADESGPNAYNSAPGNSRLAGGRLLARNAIWNLFGYMLPLVVAVPAIPMLIHSLGINRFGVLALAWVVLGYASFLDLGLGRALTQLVARRLATEDETKLASTVWTAIALMLGVGLLIAAGLLVLAPPLIHDAIKIPRELQSETLGAFYLLALSVPIVVTSIGLRSVLEAKQRFLLVNAVRLPMGILMFVGPILVLPFSHDLGMIVGSLVVGRAAAWVAYLVTSLRVMPSLLQGIAFTWSAVPPLARFGSWTTVSNVVSPLMVNLDRFLIASLVSVAGVAYYATPYEVVTKLTLIAGAVAGVLFPAFATTFVADPGRARFLFVKGVRFIFLALFPLTITIVALAYEGIGWWLGPEFAAHSTTVMQLLAFGVLLNALAQLPFALIQGIGRPDLTAKLHLLELPLYCIALFWAISTWGIVGAALASTIRVSIDAAVLYGMAHRFLPAGRLLSRGGIWAAVYGLFTLAALQPATGIAKLSLVAVALAGYVPIAWLLILSREERSQMLSLLGRPGGGSRAEIIGDAN